jgi:tungstate transport system substrate-binding protein
MKKRRLAALAAAAMMALSMTACSSGSTATAAATTQAAAETKAETAAETKAAETAAAESKAAASEKKTSGAVKELPARADDVLLMATTTSTDNTGLLDYLQPIFKEDTGIDLKWVAVGTGDAIKKAEDGEVDVILVHAKKKEEAFVESGYGVKRYPVMYNDFVIVGPKNGPIAKTDDIEAAFKQIRNDELTFISRGDNSGTETKEKGIWEALGITDYEDNPNYKSAGAGMADTLAMANEMEGYTLSDRGTWLAKKSNFPDMDIVVEGAKNLLNQYGVIAVNPEKYPDVNNAAANKFIEWITSDEIQKKIGEFGVDKYGEPLFTPNAGTDN